MSIKSPILDTVSSSILNLNNASVASVKALISLMVGYNNLIELDFIVSGLALPAAGTVPSAF